eukprot:780040-Prorocentrum_minimum.AAC.2
MLEGTVVNVPEKVRGRGQLFCPDEPERSNATSEADMETVRADRWMVSALPKVVLDILAVDPGGTNRSGDAH